MGLLNVMKGLPLAYNKDMQEDKEAFFDSRDTVLKCLITFTPMLKSLTFNQEQMRKSAALGFTNATDCADYLVKKGIAFRDAHHIVGELVFYCVEKNISLEDIPLEIFKNFSSAFEEDVFTAISLETCVANRNLPGGPSEKAMVKAIQLGEDWVSYVEKETPSK